MFAGNKNIASFCCSLGFSVYWAWLFFVLLSGFFSSGHSSSVFDSAWFWSTLGHIAALTALNALSDRYSPFSRSGLFLFGSSAVSVLGFGVILYSNMFESLSNSAFVFGAVTTGIGTSGLLICWCELYSSLYDGNRKRMLLAIGVIISELLFLGIVALPRFAMTAVLAVLPFVVVVLVWLGLRHVDAAVAVKHHSEEGRLSPRFALFCLVYSIPLGFFQIRFLFGVQDPVFSWTMTIAFSLAVLVVIVMIDGFMVSKRDTSIIPKAVIPVAIGGLLLIAAFGDERAAFSGVLVYSAQQLLTILLYSEFAKISHNGRVHPAKVFALGVCLTDGGFVLGMLTGEISISFLGGFYLEVTLGVVYVVALAGFLLLSWLPREPLLQDRDDPEPPNAKRNPSLSTSLQRNIDDAALAYGLTPREREMLQYVLRGKSVPAIASETYLSRNTVKTHIMHIYAKLDVHSRDELIRFVEDIDLRASL